MANQIHTGSQGTVYVGGTPVASVRSFSIEETQETVDATVMNSGGVAFRTNKPTFKAWSGTLDVYWTVDESVDINGNLDANVTEGNTLAPGSTEVTIIFYPAGDSSYELGYEGNCLVTSRTISASVDGMIESSISVVGTTALATTNAA